MCSKCCYLWQNRILNKLTPEKFDLLKGQLIDAGITSADILKVCSLTASVNLSPFIEVICDLLTLLCKYRMSFH